jgi:hypothetical protein
VEIEKVSGSFLPDDRVEITLDKIEGLLALGSSGKGPRFGATKVTVSGPLAGARPRGFPTAAVEGGYASPLPTLSLTGIRGKVEPVVAAGADPATARELKVNLDGSYGGARETLWTAQGALDPRASEGQVALRAERFTLSEIAEVLPKTVLSPEATTVNGALDVSWAEGAVRFGGDLKVAGLSLHHPGLASDPLRDMDLELAVQGTAFPDRRRVALDKLAGRVGKLAGKVSGFVELAPGAFTFHDGSKLGFLPRIELALDVPKLPCAQALGSLPAAFVPKLQGFELTGAFGAEISTRVDYADLEALELHGKIGIDGCKVTKAPPGVKAVLSGDSIVHTVEIPPAPSTVARGAAGARGPPPARGDNEELEFIVGPENPDFVPYDKISPHLISSILTTEDNGFFKHRGWVSSEFKNALRRNLQRGGFRGGASSITMQMVKNVLLGQEKTLSRKLQELFLVWYLEKEVPKERILELYFNAIEFGPRIYGIGLAARHYFAKPAAELTPLEGAFFSSILPSPKRRYIQYCHGTLHPPWDKYVRRILAKAHERGRVSDEDFAAAAEQKVVFDRKDNFSERQCLDWVKKITVKPEPEAPPDIDAALDGDPVTDGRDRGRGGAGKGGKRGAVGKAKKRLSPEPRLVKTAAQ